MPTHADKVNAQYDQKTSNFISLQQRLNEALQLAPVFAGLLISAVAEFKRRNPNWIKFEDIHLCQAIQVSIDSILIDTTMQRALNMRHVINILSNFQETMVMAIQVYEDASKPGYYIAWDGQHTAIALYVILTKVFGQQLANAMVPVVVYSVKQKLQIRRNFILLNGDAKEQMDFIDIYKQQVSGVMIDGATDQEWQDNATKNKYFKDAGLFATHSKFGDEDEPGAFTLLADTLMSKSLKTRKHPEVTRMFARYWTFLNEQRPVAAKEARQLYEYFNACYVEGITVDDTYLLELTAFTKQYFGADFSEHGMFWDKVKMAYTAWYAKANPDSFAEFGLKGFVTEWRCGGPFLIAQIKKSTGLKTPTYVPNNGFTVDKKDLW